MALDPTPSETGTPHPRPARLRPARRRALARAAAARRADRSEFYAPSFTNGLCTPDLERSAAAAGEPPGALSAHFVLFDRTLLPLCGFFRSAAGALRRRLPLRADAASPRPLKIVRALARLAWRLLRLPLTQSRWERRAVCFRLHELAAWRRRHGPLTLARLNQFQDHLDGILSNHLWESDRLEPLWKRFKRLWDLLFEPDDENDASDPAGHNSSLETEPLEDDASAPQPDSSSSLGAEPLEDDAGTPLPDSDSSLGAEPPENDAGAPPSRRQVRQRQARERLLQRVDRSGPEELSNPFRPPSHARRRERRAPSAAEVRSPAEGRPRRRKTPKLAGPAEDGPFQPDPRRRNPPDRLLRQWVKSGQLQVPERYQDFAELARQALGSGDGPSTAGHASQGADRTATRAPRKAKAEARSRGAAPAPKTAPRTVTVSHRPSANFRRPSANARRPSTSARRASTRAQRPRTRAQRRSRTARQASANARRRSRTARQTSASARRRSTTAERASTRAHAAARDPELEAFSQALWSRLHLLEPRRAPLADLLAATLAWDAAALARLWPELLGAEDAFYARGLLARSASLGLGGGAYGIAFRPALRRSPRPPDTPARLRRSALAYWFSAVLGAFAAAALGHHAVTVALWELGVSRFGVREELLEWRPELSMSQWHTRRDRPEWQVRVTTAEGRVLVVLEDGTIFEPEDARPQPECKTGASAETQRRRNTNKEQETIDPAQMTNDP